MDNIITLIGTLKEIVIIEEKFLQNLYMMKGKLQQGMLNCNGIAQFFLINHKTYCSELTREVVVITLEAFLVKSESNKMDNFPK